MESIEETSPACVCRMDKSGRIVLPSTIREAKGLTHGDELIASFECGAIVLRTYAEAMQRLQDAFCEGLDPELSLVDELISERKQEAELDDRC